MPHFYATAEDLISVFEQVEATHSLQYALCGHSENPEVKFYYSGLQLPTLREPLANESAVCGPAYLVSQRDAEIRTRELSPFNGGRCFAVDQLYNEDTIVLWNGGLYGQRILLYGRVDTASNTKIACRLQRAFTYAIKKLFSRIQAYYVGPNAEHLLDLGYRLTLAEQTPTDFDLRREQDPSHT